MKKVLIITYYWPPKGGVGVQRWLKLTKYLFKYGITPIIYTPQDGFSPLEDRTLSKSIPEGIEIIKNKIIEPQKILSFFTKKLPSSDILVRKEKSILTNFFIWLRANLFIPDSRSLWVKPSIRFLTSYLKKNHVDIIISTGPPHSLHLIPLALKKKYNFKWISDFRDPWTDIEYFDRLPLLPWNRNIHFKLERKVLSSSDLIMTVSPSWAKRFKDLGAKNPTVITNGFDKDDYLVNKMKSIGFQIGHFGLYNELRDHSFFWKTILKICRLHPELDKDLKFLFAGEVYDTFDSSIDSYLGKKISFLKNLNHAVAIQHMMISDLLLVTQADTKAVLGRLPAKFFEYLGARRPILAIGKKNSDLEKIIDGISYAWFVDFNNSELLYDTILKIYRLSKKKYDFRDDITSFSREEQAKQMVEIIHNI